MITLRKTSVPDGIDPYRWQQLGMYNAEVGRGLVHTEAWHAKMAAEQQRFENHIRLGGSKYFGSTQVIVKDNVPSFWALLFSRPDWRDPIEMLLLLMWLFMWLFMIAVAIYVFSYLIWGSLT